jgi:hypothetical protein
MVEETIDITPTQIGGKANKGVIFQDSEWEQINKNPKGLTKEGIDKEIELWSNSSNKQVVMKYQTMKRSCKNITASGTTPDGEIILARNKDGTPTWVEKAKSVSKKK